MDHSLTDCLAKDTYRKMQQELESLIIEIVIEVKDSLSGKAEKRSIEFRLMDEEDENEAVDFLENDQEMEEMQKLIDYIAQLQRKESNLLNKVTAKIQQLHQELTNKAYKISLVKKFINQEQRNKRKINVNHNENHSVRRKCVREFPKQMDSFSNILIIGPYGTEIHRIEYESISWQDAKSATGDLCSKILGERVLSRQCLNGNNSLTIHGNEVPDISQLAPEKIADIIYLVTLKCGVSIGLVRDAITEKCADAKRKSINLRRRC